MQVNGWSHVIIVMYLLWGMLLLGMLLPGISLIWSGWRGEVVDDHPLCKRCRYDLVGCDSMTIHCPECGLDLLSDESVIIGNRKIHKGKLWGGLACMVMFVLAVLLTLS
jgi:hypothetical protein